MPRGQELYLALKSLGVPPEFIVYPGEDHALREPRNTLVSSGPSWGGSGWIRGAEG